MERVTNDEDDPFARLRTYSADEDIIDEVTGPGNEVTVEEVIVKRKIEDVKCYICI